MSKGHLFIISGPSGVGKTAVLERLRKRLPSLGRIVTYTTRQPRPGEKNGIHYHFVTHQQFREMIQDHAFLEWATVHGQLYGTPKHDTLDHLAAGTNIVLIIDVQGAMAVKQKMPEAILVFIEPDNIKNLMNHLKSRRGMDQAEMDLRLKNAEKELAKRDAYDFIVKNREGYIEETAHDIGQIILNVSKKRSSRAKATKA